MKQWDKIFKKQGKVFKIIQEDIPRVANLFKKKGIKKVLDLGCGSGRHTIYLVKHGFEVYGIDIAPVGIKLTKDWLRQEHLQADLKLGSIYRKLPYKDKFFDAIIAIQVINHAKIGNIRNLIKEVERVLKPNGFIFITARRRKLYGWRINSIKTEKYKEFKTNYKIIGPRTYVPIDGGEKGLIHYVFNKNTLKKEFKNFKIYDIYVSPDKRHYCLLAELK